MSADAPAEIAFRPIAESDVPLLHRWLNSPGDVFTWYAQHKPTTLAEIAAEYQPLVDGTEATRGFVIEIDGAAIGYIQAYNLHDWPTYWGHVGMPEAAGVDIYIGEGSHQHQGLGSTIIRRFLREVVFVDPTITACVIDPDPANAIAIRAYEKVGFRYLRTIGPPQHSEISYLMRLEPTDVEAMDNR